MAKYGRFNIGTKPSGIAPADDAPYPCGWCGRRIMPGQPYWGGGIDYFGEANDVSCARCEAAQERADERMHRDMLKNSGT